MSVLQGEVYSFIVYVQSKTTRQAERREGLAPRARPPGPFCSRRRMFLSLSRNSALCVFLSFHYFGYDLLCYT